MHRRSAPPPDEHTEDEKKAKTKPKDRAADDTTKAHHAPRVERVRRRSFTAPPKSGELTSRTASMQALAGRDEAMHGRRYVEDVGRSATSVADGSVMRASRFGGTGVQMRLTGVAPSVRTSSEQATRSANGRAHSVPNAMETLVDVTVEGSLQRAGDQRQIATSVANAVSEALRGVNTRLVDTFGAHVVGMALDARVREGMDPDLYTALAAAANAVGIERQRRNA